MRILAIESSSLVASVAILNDDIISAEYTVNFKKTHSQTLLPMLDEIVRMTECSLNDIDAIAVSGGPGSFTGLRIGAATAKGLGLALSKPLIKVPTLDATAYNLQNVSGLICPIMDARRNQVYTGLYRYEREFEIIKASRAMDMAELTDELNEKNERVVFLGDGLSVYKNMIERNLKTEYAFANPNSSRQRAASVACLGARYFAEGRFISSEEFEPEYLRKSQAEREREERGRC